MLSMTYRDISNLLTKALQKEIVLKGELFGDDNIADIRVKNNKQNKKMNTPEYNHEKYPIIIGKKYQYFDLEGKDVMQTKEFAILKSADLDENIFRLEIIDSSWFWQNNYGAFIYHWKLVKE